MNRISKIILVSGFVVSGATAPLMAQAQSYHGDYPGTAIEDNEKITKAIPKVFSSQISSVNEGEKLDLLYNNLLIALWNYAYTDFTYQKRMYELIKPEKFQYTRYSKEFNNTMENAMDNLNSNYKKMLSDIESAQAEYLSIKEGIRKEDYKILDSLWADRINALSNRSDNFFKMQNQFLNTYKSLVAFILQQGGSYYYKSAEDRVYFYQFGGYKYFGLSLDKLKKTTYDQKVLLKENAPVNSNVAFE